MRRTPPRIERRTFVAGALALPASCGWMPRAVAAHAAGGDRLRVGLVGCGGRGTGAAADAAAAARGVTITCMADAFADQVDSSAAMLARRVGGAFACPAASRFVGIEAWRHVVESDVDLVILATPPAFRPAQALAAVAAGKHVWCETPGAVDEAGIATLARAAEEAAARGLSFASGLGHRHDDAATAALVARIRDGGWGRPLAVTVRADLGLPWVKPARRGWTEADLELRNWISCDRLSGGHFVERHVAALDRALWALGDVDPVAVVPGASAGEVRYLLHDGATIDASLRRRCGGPGSVEESVRCGRGVVDLRRPADAPTGDLDPLRVAMADLVSAIRSGRRLDHSAWLCRATRAAVAGQTVLATGRSVPWTDGPGRLVPTARPIQSFEA